LLLLAVALIIGIVTLPDYGESWDEADIRRYSEYAVAAYPFLLHPQDLVPFETNLNLYGPAYVALAGLMVGFATRLAPLLSPVTAWHGVHFVTFLIGVLLLYLLALRWMSDTAAFGAALLFITQPLFWGHAFINPKDIAFMTMFLAAVYFGLRAVDQLRDRTHLTPTLVVAAVMLGITTSLRVLGPLAGFIVLGYAVLNRPSRFVLPAALYLALAALTTYLSWPYLWAAPVSRFIESLGTMADFPFNSVVLFAGGLYKADALPAVYFPALVTIQLTESAVVLVAAGIIAAVMLFVRGSSRQPLLLLLAWFLLPTLAIVSFGSPLYDNARQLYFLFPPLFIAAGVAFDHVFRLVRRPALQAAVLLAAALPGVLIGARMHPYEYVYYNALVGGTGGAFRNYEMDYWGTSFDEISLYANQTLPNGASVLVYGPGQIVAARARPDLQVSLPREDFDPGYDYVILLTRSNADQRLCRETETLFSVGRRGAVFSELRSIPPGVKCR
jgi:hypothetical protein